MDKIDKKLAAIEKAISVIKENMSTKEDMKTLELGLKGEMESLKSELKEDMKTLEVRLTERIEEAQMEIIAAVDKHKADKASVKILEKRVERLENNVGLPPYAEQ